MLAFVTSLAHPDDIADVVQSDALLARTLESLSHQCDTDYVILIVGDRKPEISLPDRTEFIPVTFPPRGESGGYRNRELTWTNKGSKLAIGLVRAHELGAEYAMIFDYDDFVHRDVAQFVNSRPGQDGWYVPAGWLHSNRRNVIQPLEGLNRRCGTCNIVRLSAFEVPDGLPLSASQADVLAAFGPHIYTIIGRHWQVPEHLAEREIFLQPVPFRAVMYNLETSLNLTGSVIPGFVRPLTARRAREFGIRPALGMWTTLGYVLAPNALAQGIERKFRRLTKRLSRSTKQQT